MRCHLALSFFSLKLSEVFPEGLFKLFVPSNKASVTTLSSLGEADVVSEDFLMLCFDLKI